MSTTGEGCRSPHSRGPYHADDAFAHFSGPDGERWVDGYAGGVRGLFLNAQDGEERLKLLLAKGWTYMDKDDIETTFGTAIAWPADSSPVVSALVDCADFSGGPLAFSRCSLVLAGPAGFLHWAKLQRILGDDLYLSYCWSSDAAGPKEIDACKYGRGGHMSPRRAECARWALVAYGSPLSAPEGERLMPYL